MRSRQPRSVTATFTIAGTVLLWASAFPPPPWRYPGPGRPSPGWPSRRRHRCRQYTPRPLFRRHDFDVEIMGASTADPMILPHYSYLLAGLIPQAQVKIYPDSAHGFLFQHHAEFARDVDVFLSE